jgi:hypothetical protein
MVHGDSELSCGGDICGCTSLTGCEAEIPFPLVAFLHGINMVVEPFTMVVVGFFKVCWKEIQVRMKEVYFERHIAAHRSVGFKHLLDKLSEVGRFVVAKKFVNSQF